MMEKTDSSKKLYTRMRLWEFQDKYVIEPTDGSPGSSLAISKVDGAVSQTEEIPESESGWVPKSWIIYGVIGMLKLVAGSYLLVITDRESVGHYMRHPVFKILSLKIFPCDHSTKNLSEEHKKMEIEFSTLLRITEKTPGLYFSYDANLTLSLQRLRALGDESNLLPLWRQSDPRFLWNSYLMEVLVDHKLDPFLLPVVQGSFQNFQTEIEKNVIDVTLIARRCVRRTGTRMWRRGADPDGYVANFVESEQIVQLNGFTASFIQIRGSIPLLWEQIVDLKYKPKFEIVRPEDSVRVAERHFLDLRRTYGAVFAVDLVNGSGAEGRLSEKFAGAMQGIRGEDGDVRYLHFDFHRICGHVHFENLCFLYEEIEGSLEKNGYLLLNDKGETIIRQGGVVRTNCIDCLDRTNVTQSMIGRKMMETQLRKMGVFDAEETIVSHPHFDSSFKILWANHGDDISIQYSGTPALKGDFVRYGRRTFRGIASDGWNAMVRYYLNNFRDGTKQDATDLVHGNFIIAISTTRDAAAQSTPPPSSSKKTGLEVTAASSFPLAAASVVSGLLFAVISLRHSPSDLRHLFYSMAWGSVSLTIAALVKANGRVFCNRPRLFKRGY